VVEATGVVAAGMAAAVVVDAFLTATHFSFPSPGALSPSSSEVTLSSVSASTPVVFSDSELDADVVSDAVASPDVVAAGVVSVDEVDVAVEESLFAVASARSFLALAARSFLSSFCVHDEY
jgi:hypothetical protein